MKKRLQRIIAKGQFLDEIMAWKRQEVPSRMTETPETDLRALLAFTPPALDFAAALAGPGVSLIAEVKRATPDKGLIAKDFDPVAMALDYVEGGASAISCITDARFFQGQLEYLTAIKEAFRQENIIAPVLRRDFIYHPYHVLQARVAGADAISLIMTILSDADYHDLLAYARELGMEALIEVHDEAELERALKESPHIICLNHRNLRTFEVDMSVTHRLRPLLPENTLAVSAGGIRSAGDVEKLKESGVDAMLMGESLARQSPAQRKRKVKQFVRAGQEI